MLKVAEISGFPAGDTPYKKTDERGLYIPGRGVAWG